MTIRVLHVDHDSSVLELSRTHLRDEGGLFLDTATNGAEGLEKMRQWEYDVLVTEHQLPDMEVRDFIHKVREESAEVPIVLFTSRDKADLALTALNNGASFCLLKNDKPDMHFPELLEIVRRAYRERSLEKAVQDKLETCHLLAETIPDTAYLYTLPDKGFRFMSPSVEALLGYSAEEFLSRANLAFELTHPEDETRFSELWVKPETAQRNLVVRLRHKNGLMRWVEINQAPILDEKGAATAVTGVVRDVTDREMARERLKRRDSLRKMHNEINRSMLKSEDRESLFEAVCMSAVEAGGFRMAWIGLVDDRTGDVNPVATCGVEDGYLEHARITVNGPTEVRGPAATSILENRVVVGKDVRSDESMSPWQDKALSRDYRSIASAPIRLGGKAVGVVVLYSSEPRFFDEDAVAVLERLTDDVSRALDRIAREEKRRAVVDKLASHYYLLDVISDAVYVTDNDFVITAWNKGAERSYGWRADEAVGKRSYELLRTEFAGTTRSHTIRVLSDTGEFRGEVHQRRSDGARITVSTSIFAIRDDAGRITGYVGVNRDVTKEREAFAQIREQERLLSDVFTSIDDGICVIDRSLTVVRVNPTIERWYAHAMPLIGRKCHDAYFFSDSPCEDCPSREALRTGRTVIRLLHRKGPGNASVGWIEVHAFPMVSRESGDTIGVIEYMRDYTERKHMEETLRESEEKYRNIIELASEGIWTVDARGITTLANPKLAESLGYTVQEMVGRSLYSFMDEANARTVRTFMETSLGDSVISKDADLIRKDGSRVILSVSARRIHDSEGKVVGAIAVTTDLTERRELEAQLRRMNEKLALVGSAMRHDAMNQVGVMAGWLSVAMDECRDEAISRYLSNMKRATDNLQDQLEFARDYHHMGTAQPEWLDVRQAILRGVSGLDVKGISMEIKFEGLQILSDPMLEKVFRNIVDNSVRHGSGVRTVVCEAGRRDQDMVISVEDDGVGIPLEEKQKIFERGYGKHTGLGLYLVQEILAITGIKISETGTPGKGARFEVLVPSGKFRIVSGPPRRRERKS